jgi:hypothetical protein
MPTIRKSAHPQSLSPYVVDSNFFLQAYKMHYPIDVTPGFWIKVSDLANQGRIISIDKVHDELYTNPDPLTNWMNQNLPTDFFKDTNSVLSEYSQVCAWASSRSTHYKAAALNTFLQADEADAFLVSYALAHKLTLITHETSDPNRKSSIKIPDACAPFKVQFLNTIQMFRAMGETF